MARADKPAPGTLQRLRYRCAQASTRLLALLLRALPLSWGLALCERLGPWLGEWAHRRQHARRRTARRQLRLVLGDELRPPERQALVRRMFHHMGRMSLEYGLLLSGRELGPWSRWVELENPELATELIERHGAVIFVTCHGGNFELLGARASELFGRLHVVMKDLQNPYLSADLARMRERLGMGVIRKFPALRDILRTLRAGRNVAMLCDQRRRRRGLIVDFFGRPAATVDTPAVLALRFGLPVVPGYCYSTGRALRYRAYLDTPILPDRSAARDAEVVRITREINASIERFVRAHPDQWNWTQPRWRLSEKVEARARRRSGDRAGAAEISDSAAAPRV